MTGWAAHELAELAACDAAALAARFAVLPAGALERSAEAPPTAGVFDVDGDALRFWPKHPFAPGTTYAFLSRGTTGAGEPLLITRDAEVVTPTTGVTGIHPTAGELPLNALRFYLHFSAPMSEGDAADAVQLRDGGTGEVLAGAFLPMPPELWDPGHTRLTLLLDPGRIKRGLRPHDEAGYPLTVGQDVVLTVGTGFADSLGAPLRAGAERRYRIGEPIRRLLDPSAWTVGSVRAGTRHPVRVIFDRPIDHALGERCLSVVDGTGRTIPGRGTLADGETCWEFVPSLPWAETGHRLRIEPQLEDVAGNSPVRVFDRDLTDPTQTSPRGHIFLNIRGVS